MGMCATSLAHVEHWQAALASIMIEAMLLIAVCVVVWRAAAPGAEMRARALRCARVRMYPLRPLLLQELFARGILNRKEAYCVL